MKKFCILFVLLISMLSIGVTTEALVSVEGTCGTNAKWSYERATLTISGSGEMKDYAGSFIVPWKDYLENILFVKIESGITRIGDHAFDTCVNLRSVQMASSVKTIGDYAFAWTNELEVMGLGRGVTELESYVFDESSLHILEVPKSLEKIGKGCFTNMDSDINYGLSTIYYEGEGMDWSSINVASDNGALDYADVITRQKPVLMMRLSSSSVSLPADGSTQIITASDYENVGINSLSVSWKSSNNSVATVSKGVITAVSPGTATITATYHGYTASCSVTVSSVASGPATEGNFTYEGTTITGCIHEYGYLAIPEYVGGRAVTAIAPYAFYNLSAISDVEIPATVTSIGEYAFYGTGINNVYYQGDSYAWKNISIGSGNSDLTNAEYISYSNNIYFSYITDLEYNWNFSRFYLVYTNRCATEYAHISATRYDSDGKPIDSSAYYVELPGYSDQAEAEFTMPIYSFDGYIEFEVKSFDKNGTLIGKAGPYTCNTDKVIRYCNNHRVHVTGYRTAEFYDGGYEDYENDLVCIPNYIESDGEFFNVTGICDDAFDNYPPETLVIPESVKKIGKNLGEGYNTLKTIYYMGSSSDWNQMEIDSENSVLNRATIHYNDVSHNVINAHFTDGVIYEAATHKEGYIKFDLGIQNVYKSCTAVVEVRNSENNVLKKELSFSIDAGYNKNYPIEIPLKPDDEQYNVLVRFELNGEKCGDFLKRDYILAGRPIYYEKGFAYKIYDDKYSKMIDYQGEKTDFLIIPETLGDYPVEEVALYGVCESQKIRIPASVKRIEEYLIAGFPNLTDIEVSENNTTYCDVDGVVFTKDKKSLCFYPPNKKNPLLFPIRETYTVPNGIEKIEAGAFVTAKLDEVIFPDTLTHIAESAFGKSYIKKVTIPASVELIEGMAFSYCENLTEINVSKDNRYYCDIDGVLYSKDGTILYQYPCGKKLHTYIIGDTVTELADFSLEMTSIKALYIPKSVTKIGMGALSTEFNCIAYEGTEEDFYNTFDVSMINTWVEWIYSFEGADAIFDKVESRYLDKKLNVQAEFKYLTMPGVCIAAIYDSDNRMIDLKTYDVDLSTDKATFEFTANENYLRYTVKVMYWNEVGSLSPVTFDVETYSKESILIDSVIESDHPCTFGYNSYTYDGECESIDITFSAETDIGSSGVISIYLGDFWQSFNGADLAGKTLRIEGNRFELNCFSDLEKYGYKIEKIVVNL